MPRFNTHARFAGLAACSAMAAALLVGCAARAPLASAGASPAVADDRTGTEADKAVAAAEKRVGRSPRDASSRLALAQAYLDAGRFESAATTFQDAQSLGEDTPRIGLGLALAYIGSGRNAEALTVLSHWRNDIPASDLGLALALAGRPEQAAGVLSDAVRNGDNTPKTRQNLAYAYALGGHWAQAQIIAAQDVPADQLEARLREWGSRARPEQFQSRVAALIGAPVRADAGQPAALALNAPVPGGPDDARIAAAAPVAVPQPVAAAELPAIAAAPQPAAVAPAAKAPEVEAPEVEDASAFAQAFASQPAPLATSAASVPKIENAKFVSQPKVAPLGAARSAYVAGGTHLVQLGSFRTREGASRAWNIFVDRNPGLKDHTMRITEAEVRGQRYFRVAAEGFDRGGAASLCSTLRDRGHGCFAYAGTRTLPGALPATGPAAAKLARR